MAIEEFIVIIRPVVYQVHLRAKRGAYVGYTGCKNIRFPHAYDAAANLCFAPRSAVSQAEVFCTFT